MSRPLPFCVALLVAFSGTATPAPEEEVAFAVFSDPHYYAPELGTSGAAFEAYLAQDRKMLRESGAILDSALGSITSADVDFLLVCGDLTKDGARTSHEGVASRLGPLRDAGIPVFVVPGNHDVNNPHAVGYEGDEAVPVDDVGPQEFALLYADFGYDAALLRDPSSLSYVAEPVEGVWVIGIDSCRYEENAALGRPVTGGRIRESTRVWLDRVLTLARENHKTPVAFQHHGVLEHFTGQSEFFAEYLIEQREVVAKDLAGAGLELVFTGHFHAQDSVRRDWDEGGPALSLTDVQTGSLVTYPSPLRIVRLSPRGEVSIQSLGIEEVDYDTGALTFPEYALDFLRQGILMIALRLLTLPPEQGGFGLDPGDERLDELAGHAADAFQAHFPGDEAPDLDTIATVTTLATSDDPFEEQVGFGLIALWTDLPPDDNDLTVELARVNTPFGPGDRVRGELTDVGEVDRYEVYLTEGSKLRMDIRAQAGGVHPGLLVTTPVGTEELGTGIGERRRGRLSFTAETSGLHRVTIEAYVAESTGRYLLTTKGKLALPRLRERDLELADGETMVLPPEGDPPLQLPAGASIRIRAKGKGPRARRLALAASALDPADRASEVQGRFTSALAGAHRIRFARSPDSPVDGGPFSLKVTGRYRPVRRTVEEP